MPGNRKTLFIHGINLKPEKLSELLTAVNVEGSTLISLFGHAPSESTKDTTAQIWKKQLRDEILQHAQGNTSLSLLGYSLGGLLASLLVLSDKSLPVKKLCLIAPAITPHFSRFYDGLSKAFCSFLPIPLPSLMNYEYSANTWVYPEFYSSLFDLVTECKSIAPSLRDDVRVKAFFHPRDCLVNSTKSNKLLREHFNHYESDFSLLAPSRPTMNHLLIDEISLGSKIFNDLTVNIKAFLE